MTLYKAVRIDGTSFARNPDGTRVRWTAEDGSLVPGLVVRHPVPGRRTANAATYLSVSTEPADCTGFSWPCRLLTVEPVTGSGDFAWEPHPATLPHERGSRLWRVTGEIESWRALGPNGKQVDAFLRQIPTLTAYQWDAARAAARAAAWDAARCAARCAAWCAVWDAARGAVWDAARDAAVALVMRDLISDADFATLTAPMRAAGIDFDRLEEPK